MARDLHNNIAVRRCIDPQSVSTNTAIVSQIIDRAGYETCEFLITSGPIASGTAVFTATLEHGDSATLADTSAITDPSSLLLGTLAGASFTFSSPNSQFRLGYIGGKRYVRLTITTTSNAAAALIAALAVLGAPAKAPTP
ncbi:MAG: hypothetical protein JWO71_3119 [Candidatus Acidoferrum typicum]|nr:hypothetical protein [Candidatus Acidoferrum typicum]